jgi:phenylalanyl-tRNA synthetase beta chain
MKVTYNWLKKFVEIPVSPEELVQFFEELGIEVEEFKYLGEGLKDRVVVGEIVELRPHPKRENWRVLRVNVGDGTLRCVSGAPNLEVGQKVAYAKPGTVLPDGRKIETIELGGIPSEGMPLSEEDLGVPIKSEGVLELPSDLKVGESVLPLLFMDDWLYDLYITPNRPDLLSVLGLARELYVKFGTSFKEPDPQVEEDLEELYPVVVEDKEACPRYTARIVRGVKVCDSPPHIRYPLSWCGIRPINNVVDITNYVLLEMGHPIHAFDLVKLDGEIRVRFAKKGERLLTLDEVERELEEDVLLIADIKKPLAIAGIMGGEESGVKEETRDILIESAYFDPVTIRKGTSRLSLDTESSFRFARGADPEMASKASLRVAELLKEVSPDCKVGPLQDVCYIDKFSKALILKVEKVNGVLGVDIADEVVESTLERMGFGVVRKGDRWRIEVPKRRVDMDWEEDLIEEIARFYGYERIPATLSKGGCFVGRKVRTTGEILREHMLSIGFTEILGLDFVSREEIEAFGIDPKGAVRIKNPLGEPYEFMRTHLSISLLQVISTNINRGIRGLRILEVGRVFIWRDEKELPHEPLHLAAVVAGEREPHWRVRGSLDYYDLKGALDSAAVRMGWDINFGEGKFPHLASSASIYINGDERGWIGEFDPEFLRNRYEIKVPAYGFELDIEGLEVKEPIFRPPPKYPPVKRALSLLLPLDTNYEEVVEALLHLRLPYLTDVNLIDLYTGKPLPPDKKSMTFSLTFQNPEATLTDREVDDLMSRLIEEMQARGYKVRGVEDGT